MPKRKPNVTAEEAFARLFGPESGSDSSDVEREHVTQQETDPELLDSVFVSDNGVTNPSPEAPPPPRHNQVPQKRKRGRPKAVRPVPNEKPEAMPQRPDSDHEEVLAEEREKMQEWMLQRAPEIARLEKKKRTPQEDATLQTLLRRNEEDNHLLTGEWKWEEFDTEMFSEFDQSEFVNPSRGVMDNTGYVYVPTNCNGPNSNCKVHVSLHGCRQGKSFLGDEYALHTGYNEVAELNNIIVIYPQAETNLSNMNGCWDWWGYTGINYACDLADQMKAIKGMIDTVLA